MVVNRCLDAVIQISEVLYLEGDRSRASAVPEAGS